MSNSFENTLVRVQGGYFVLTGIWPLLHFRSFEAITGRKPEPWLVKMVGLLAASIGVTLCRSVRRPEAAAEARVLALTSAASFLAIDVWYAGQRRISPVYLLDAAVEIGFLSSWVLSGRSRQTKGATVTAS